MSNKYNLKVTNPSLQIQEDILSSTVNDIRQTVKQLTPINHWGPFVNTLNVPESYTLSQPNYCGGGMVTSIKIPENCIVDSNQYHSYAPIAETLKIPHLLSQPNHYGGGMVTSINNCDNWIVNVDKNVGYSSNAGMMYTTTSPHKVLQLFLMQPWFTNKFYLLIIN